jgi:hypothetical protein
VAGGIPCETWCSPVGLLNVSQAGLELASGDEGALLFSQFNVVWRSFVQAVGSGCRSFDSSWCFISAKCGSSVLAIFLIYGAHSFCFYALVTILHPPFQPFKYKIIMASSSRDNWTSSFPIYILFISFSFPIDLKNISITKFCEHLISFLLWKECL